MILDVRMDVEDLSRKNVIDVFGDERYSISAIFRVRCFRIMTENIDIGSDVGVLSDFSD